VSGATASHAYGHDSALSDQVERHLVHAVLGFDDCEVGAVVRQRHRLPDEIGGEVGGLETHLMRGDAATISAVAPSRRESAAACVPRNSRLTRSKAIEHRSATRPRRSTRLAPHRRASLLPSNAAPIAMIVCGTNSPPYSAFDRA